MQAPIVDSDFAALIPPLRDGEYALLEASIVADGCRDALVVWGNLLLDGHNRLEICARLKIAFETRAIGLPDRDAATEWIIINQLGRRNLTPFVRAELALKLKPTIEKRAKEHQRQSLGRGKKGLPNSVNLKAVNTQQELAQRAGIGHDTIAKAETIIKKADKKTKAQLRSGELSINAVHKTILKAERKEKQEQRENEARKTIPEGKAWCVVPPKGNQTVGYSADVIPCDALITDPPYGILTEKWEPGGGGIEDITRLWATCWNRCEADFILTFFSQRYMWYGREWFDESFIDYDFHQLLIWHYPNNKSPQNRMGFKQTWEPIFFYRRKDSNKQIRVRGTEWGNGLTDFDCHVAAVPQTNFNDADRKVHPAQKPVSAMRWLINATTDPGNLVCDPFSGSGTTGIAATQLGRRFHGIEQDVEMREIAEKRIACYGRV